MVGTRKMFGGHLEPMLNRAYVSFLSNSHNFVSVQALNILLLYGGGYNPRDLSKYDYNLQAKIE